MKTMCNKVKPYNFADLLGMNPGKIIGGLVRPKTTWMLSPDWEVPTSLKLWKHIILTPYLEHRVRWRQHLRKYSKMVKQTKLYRPPVELLKNKKENGNAGYIGLELEIDKPIGIYLGHIIRFNGVSLVNVLTSDGYDIWI